MRRELGVKGWPSILDQAKVETGKPSTMQRNTTSLPGGVVTSEGVVLTNGTPEKCIINTIIKYTIAQYLRQ